MYSTHDISAICGVALTTVASWIDKKKIKGFRTPGGHRRVKRTDLIEFLQRYNMPVPSELAEDKCSVVLIEPDPELARMAVEAIEEGGEYQVEIAPSALRAGAAATSGIVDIVVVDLDMPGLDAAELCRVLRSNASTRKVPVVALGNPSENESNELREAGMSDFLAKPFDGRKIAKKIRRHCPAPVRY
jgi:excisionase family DNA binding protein